MEEEYIVPVKIRVTLDPVKAEQQDGLFVLRGEEKIKLIHNSQFEYNIPPHLVDSLGLIKASIIALNRFKDTKGIKRINIL